MKGLLALAVLIGVAAAIPRCKLKLPDGYQVQ